MPRQTDSKAQRIAVPDAARPFGTASATGSYEVAFRVAVRDAASHSAERWIRATFQDAPRRWRWFLLVGWTAITCRLRPSRSPSRVLGWQVESTSLSPAVAVIVVRAWVGFTARIVALVDADADAAGDTVTLCSFVEYAGPTAPVARVMWAMTVPLHELVLPHLLTAAARRHRP